MKTPTVKKDPVMEAIARKLFGIEGVPNGERSRMVARAVTAGRDAIMDELDALRAHVEELEEVVAKLEAWKANHSCQSCGGRGWYYSSNGPEDTKECADCRGTGLEVYGALDDACASVAELEGSPATTPEPEVTEMIDRLTELAQELETIDGYQENLRVAVDWLKRWVAQR